MDSNLWRKFASFSSGHPDSKVISEIKEYRLNSYCGLWQIFKAHFYPSGKALKQKSVDEIYKVWTWIDEFCHCGYIMAFVVTSSDLEMDKTTDPTVHQYYNSFMKNCMKSFDFKKQRTLLINNLFLNIDEAICNEQKGEFDLARKAYKKAQAQMREAVSSGQFEKGIKAVCLMIVESTLKEIDANWEYKVFLQTGYKPNPPFQFNATADIPYTLMAKNYQERERLQADFSKPKDIHQLYKFLEDIVQLISAVNYISQLPSQIAQFPAKENNQELAIQFSPWCILDEEKTKKFNFDKISTAMKEKLGLVGKETSAKTCIQSAEILDGASTKKSLYRFLYIPSEIEVSDYLEELD